MATNKPEVWQRGPIEGVPALLQPVAHALLQSVEDVEKIMDDFPDTLLWERPAQVASPAFHLQHMPGVLDRLCTYARYQQLREDQLDALKEEGKEVPVTGNELVGRYKTQVNKTIEQLKATDPATLTDFRPVGRKQLPSTVMGLFFHAAEHVQRHTGQLLVTARIVRSVNSQ